MRFLWQSNAPWAGTGYGVQTKLMLRALLERGHEPACFAFYGLQGGSIEYDGYPVLPTSGYNPWGDDVIAAHAKRMDAEAVVTLMDLFVLDPSIWSKLPFPWIGWVPIDSDTMGIQTLQRLKIMDYPVAMSQHGHDQMLEAGITPAGLIPHAVDTSVYKPMNKNEVREGLNIPKDTFLIGMVMANKGDRKQYPQQLRAVRQFIDKHPDQSVKVFIHTEPTSAMQGWDMKQLVDKVGLRSDDVVNDPRVFSTNQYDVSVVPAKPDLMASIYNCFDVLLNCSAGEGFGIPIIEAQACGVPVIVGDWTSMPELLRYGYTVQPAEKYLAAHYGYQYIPSVDDITYRLECVWRNANRDASLDAASWVRENFDVEIIADAWSAMLSFVEEYEKDKHSTPTATRRPTPVVTESIKAARQAMDSERWEYGTFQHRGAEYSTIVEELKKYGLQDGDRILDLGAADCDLDHFLRVVEGWKGVYTPVDLIIDGTDLRDYNVPFGYEFIVAEQVIEHLEDWKDFLVKCELTGAVVVLATPNGAVVTDHEKHDMEGQMAHVAWITPEDLMALGYSVTLKEFTGQGVGDTIIASKWNGVRTNGDRTEDTASLVSRGSAN